MADNHDDDTTPDIDDPELADFTAAFGDGPASPDEEIVAVAPDRERIRQLQTLVGATVNGAAVMSLQPLYMEMLIAVGNVWLGVAETCLSECDTDVFQLTRDEMLRILGIMSATVNQMAPAPTALAIVPTPETIN